MYNYEVLGNSKTIKGIEYYCYKNCNKKQDYGFNYVLPKTYSHFFKTPRGKTYFISVLPGVGKTHWAIKKMCKGKDKKDAVYLYIAPTISLLKETKSNLKAKGLKEGKDFYYFSSLDEINKHKTSNKFVDTLSNAKRGKIFLITHALYLSSELTRKEDVFVIVDEAQLLGVKSYTINLKDEDIEFFKEYANLELIGTPTRENNIDGNNIVKGDVEEYFQVHMTEYAINKYKRRKSNKEFLKLLYDSSNSKLEVYVMPKPKQPSFFSFTSPKHSFHGFSKIYLMGAFLELSEIYHILKREGHNLISKSEKVNPDRQDLINERFQKLEIQPLINSDRHLSKYLFDKHLVINEDSKYSSDLIINDFSKVVEQVKPLLTSNKKANPKIVNNTVKSIFLGNPYTKKVDSLVSVLTDKYSKTLSDPFNYFLRLSKKWIKKNPKHKPLLIVNSKFKNNSDLSEEFTVLTTSVHGLNEYCKKDTLVFLAALNAKPTLNVFYKHFIPSFNQEEQWIASNIVQALCRLNIRDVNSTEPTYMVVATDKTAQLVRTILRKYYFSRDTIKCNPPLVTNANFISFDDLIRNVTKKANYKTKSYLIDNSGDISNTKSLNTEQRFRQFADYNKIYKEQESLRLKITRFKASKDSKEFKELLAKKDSLSKQRKKLKIEISKRENFDYSGK